MGLQFKISLSWRITKLFIFMSQQIKTYQIHWQHGLNFPHLNKNQNQAKNSDLIGAGDTNGGQRDTVEKAKGAELYIPVLSAGKLLKYPLDLVDCRTMVNLETPHQQTSIIEMIRT